MEPTPADYETAQFTMPRSAFAVLNVSAIQARAYADGVARHRIEANTRHAGGNRIRLTCCVLMAERIIEAVAGAMRLAERRGDIGMAADLEIAMSAAVKGVDQARTRIDARLSMGDTGYLGA